MLMLIQQGTMTINELRVWLANRILEIFIGVSVVVLIILFITAVNHARRRQQ